MFSVLNLVACLFYGCFVNYFPAIDSVVVALTCRSGGGGDDMQVPLDTMIYRLVYHPEVDKVL